MKWPRLALPIVLAFLTGVQIPGDSMASDPEAPSCREDASYINVAHGYAIRFPRRLTGQMLDICSTYDDPECAKCGSKGLRFPLDGGGAICLSSRFAASVSEEDLDGLVANYLRKIGEVAPTNELHNLQLEKVRIRGKVAQRIIAESNPKAIETRYRKEAYIFLLPRAVELVIDMQVSEKSYLDTKVILESALESLCWLPN